MLWGQLDDGKTLKEISDDREKVGVFESDDGLKVRYALPMRTLREGWRSVRPMCLPVQYSSRHLPGRNSSQFCSQIEGRG